jgi:hypothetical protein
MLGDMYPIQSMREPNADVTLISLRGDWFIVLSV